MKSLHKSPTKRRRGSRGHVALHTEPPKPGDLEELYWFAVALTGDPEFATRLVALAGKPISTARGVFRT